MRTFVLIASLGLAAESGAQACHRLDPASGYPISAVSQSVGADSAWLTSVVRTVAYRWVVPSRRRNLYTGWERVRQRLLPPEPRWADDWSPETKHSATVQLTLYHNERPARLRVVTPSGDKLFDRSLASITDEPMPASQPLPRAPDSAGDSAVVMLSFGATASAPHAMIRFAAEQTRGELHRGTLNVVSPGGRGAAFPQTTVKYDITVDGAVDVGSIEFLTPQGAEFEGAIRDGLRSARFDAPTSNCRPVAQTVVQTFGGR